MRVDQYTKLLLHCNGADGSTVFIDSSFYANTFTKVGNAQHDTEKYKFPPSSYLSDGSGDYIYCPSTDDLFGFGSGDFTIDFWAYLNEAQGTARTICGLEAGANAWTQSGYAFYLQLGADSKLNYTYLKSGPAYTSIYSGAISIASAWHHIALVNNGGTGTYYVDGTAAGGGGSLVTMLALTGGTPRLYVGIGGVAGGSNPWKGWLDEFRYSKGIARWTGNFTPPTRQYGIGGLFTFHG